MKIAAVSDDGTTISQHFGRASLYAVVEVEDGQVVGTETRPKLGHRDFAVQDHGSDEPGQRRGFGQGAQARHTSMMGAISDCRALLAGGMGWGAFEALSEMGVDAVVTDVADVQEAARLYAAGDLPNLRERLH
ncbi:MAG: dinitrogenase iron-molybdenum cofactor biosynthesis protein [Chloroflexi bacterium]|nr:dinitrogenase iron-molybdenum cofactor biosynthesis protein [Chloroflexota bacterium]